MRFDDQKKIAAHYGALCGLRSEAESDSDDSTGSKPSPLQEPTTSAIPPHNGTVPRPRPESLTLPFENRERESHLVSEEEFDRIIRQEESKNPLPPLPAGVDRGASSAGHRRSISTARNTRMSIISQRPRPVSADFSRMVTNAAGQHDRTSGGSTALPRDPTLTALPRAPTKNDLMLYPTEADLSSKAGLPGYISSLRENSATSNSHRLHGKENSDLTGQAQAQKKGHKRHFSAADMFDTVKKRLRPQNTHDVEYEHARAAVGSPLSGSPAASTNSRYEGHAAVCSNGHPNNSGNEDETDRGACRSVDLARPRPAAHPDSLQKSLLKRTWSKTKHAAKASISSPLSASRLEISDPVKVAASTSTTPLNHHGHDTPTPVHSTRTTGTDNTSHYYASAESSPQNPQRPFTPTRTPSNGGGSGPLQLQHRNYEFISGPAPRRGILTKLGGPPSRNELNTMLTRQQSRIVDLTLQNNVLVGQIELLRREMQGVKVHSSDDASAQATTENHCSQAQSGDTNMPPPPRPSASARDEYFPPEFGTETPLSQDEILGLSTGAKRRTPSQSRQSFDPDGWRRIMGVRRQGLDQGEEVDVDMDVDIGMDDKRKTWMTCDS